MHQSLKLLQKNLVREVSVIITSTKLHPKKVCCEDSKAGKGYFFLEKKNTAEYWTKKLSVTEKKSSEK